MPSDTPSGFPQHICRHGMADRTCPECWPKNDARTSKDVILQEAALREANRRWPEYAADPEDAVRRSAFMAGVRFTLKEQPDETKPDEGEVTVVTNAAGECVAVTRTDAEGRVLKLIWGRAEIETNCSDPGWEMRGGDLTCKGCGRKAREIFTGHDQEKASAAAVHLLSPKRCPDCGVQYVSGARHFSGCPSHPGESAQKA